jgi:hypothetical protein
MVHRSQRGNNKRQERGRQYWKNIREQRKQEKLLRAAPSFQDVGTQGGISCILFSLISVGQLFVLIKVT